MTRGLSKSRITAFEQCPKRLWLQIHRPGLAVQDAGAKARFATGHEVGSIACAFLPDGVRIEAEPDLAAALASTRTLLAEGWDRPVFEATLEHNGVLVRIDVLEPDGAGGWTMAEVKSSTRAKAHHLGDVATQLWVAENAGLRVGKASVRHINNSFVLEREGEFDGLLTDSEVTVGAQAIAAGRPEVVAAARAVLSGPEPDRGPGDWCETPFPCEFSEYCRQAQPPGPEWPVTVLPHGGGRRWLEQGIYDLLAVDPAALTNALHRRVREATETGQPFHDVEAAKGAMEGWAFPRTWLDFETIGFAVPRWIGTRPYQQVPFQFSAHIEEDDGTIAHREFLSLNGADPRRPCAEALVALIPANGAVIGYNASFEKGRILELAEAFPDLAPALRALAGRVVDLLPVTRTCWYHRDQRGSWSIKAVLPTIAPELDYADLDVSDGGQAQTAWLEAVAPETASDRRTELDTALRIYCGRDTEAMIVLARRLLTP